MSVSSSFCARDGTRSTRNYLRNLKTRKLKTASSVSTMSAFSLLCALRLIGTCVLAKLKDA